MDSEWTVFVCIHGRNLTYAQISRRHTSTYKEIKMYTTTFCFYITGQFFLSYQRFGYNSFLKGELVEIVASVVHTGQTLFMLPNRQYQSSSGQQKTLRNTNDDHWTRDVNFVFFQKIDYRFEKIDFFFDYRIWASLSRYAVGYYVTCRTHHAVRIVL